MDVSGNAMSMLAFSTFSGAQKGQNKKLLFNFVILEQQLLSLLSCERMLKFALLSLVTVLLQVLVQVLAQVLVTVLVERFYCLCHAT